MSLGIFDTGGPGLNLKGHQRELFFWDPYFEKHIYIYTHPYTHTHTHTLSHFLYTFVSMLWSIRVATAALFWVPMHMHYTFYASFFGSVTTVICSYYHVSFGSEAPFLYTCAARSMLVLGV